MTYLHAVTRLLRPARCSISAAWLLLLVGSVLPAHAQTALADAPMFSQTNVPGNLVLALSVEFPTAVTAADRSTTYDSASKYLGYFDAAKCYSYIYNDGANGSYFNPVSSPTGPNCSGYWSGNFMNWATMQAVDPFRWALTGGYRAVDTATMTILEKAVAPSSQGSPGNNFPHKSPISGISAATPFGGSIFQMQVLRCGNEMLFRRDGVAFTNDTACPARTAWDGTSSTSTGTFSVQVRVRVCASAALKESNCVQYGSNYKPEGLIQQYASKIRYSAFGYLNDPIASGSMLRDGGVLRARMKFVGPTQPVPGSSPIPNVVAAVPGQITSAEWSAATGVFVPNPDAADATASSEVGSTITTSGVINYLNKFGQSGAYKYYDPVSELYYASTRYLRNLGDVPAYSDLSTYNGATSTLANRTVMKDGFPVIRNWADPILYSCQKNFVLGIGDTNSNQDKSVPGNATYRTNEPSTLPTEVSNDPIDVVAATNKVGVMEGMTGNIGNTNQYNTSNNSAYIAGMAYMFNTTDIRSDLLDKQTITTYWLDVLEGSNYKAGPTGRNQFYLAAKYGGFTVPTNWSYATATTAPAQALWATTSDTVPIPSAGGPRPDNFFVANQADKMISGLSSAFSRIAATSAAFTTSFSTALPQLAQTNNASFSAQYDPTNWTSEVTASVLTFDATGNPTVQTPPAWSLSSKLTNQFAGAGWNTDRRVVSWNGSAGVAFRSSGASQIASADLTALDTSYTAGNDSTNYLNYLRGDQSNEAGVGGTQAYRKRGKLLGDIVGSQSSPEGPPSFPYSDATNPGYSAFKTYWAGRRTMVYFGANDGMLHAINGALLTTAPATPSTPPLEVDANAGKEMFAYVPRALFQGPNSTPNVDGLASLGNPAFVHHYMVNATPVVNDIDFARTPGSVTPPVTTDWRSVLIGGLGKGGRAYYAIDVTDPVGMTLGGEAAVASKVLWEFTDPSLGLSYGAPLVIKTAKYGWVVVLVSGYNNSDGQGYFIFVNPRTGALLEKVSTGAGSISNDAGLAHANAFVVDSTNGTADAIYAGDLLGNLWRLDVTRTSGAYTAPTKIASFTDGSIPSNAQPVTSAPSIQIDPLTKKRVVMVGTGRLLDTADITSTRRQTFYAIFDGTNAAFTTTPAAPLTFPYTRSALAANSNALTGTAPTATQAGWYEDLGVDATSGIAWRVISMPSTFFGSVAFAAVLPNGDACSPSGVSRIYARDYSTGASAVRDSSDAAVLWVPLSGIVTNLRYLSVNGRPTLVAGTDSGGVSRVNTRPPVGTPLRRLNWRELQVVN